MSHYTPSTPSSSVPNIPLATHSFTQRYLYAFATQAEVLHYLRTQALEEERARQVKILQSWQGLQSRVALLVQSEAGLSDSIQLSPIPAQYQPLIDSYAADALFQRTFSTLPIRFALVEVDKLVAPQRTVNLDYVNRLIQGLPSTPQMEDMLTMCVSPSRSMDPIQHLEIAQNVHVFSSPNSDIRFLGAFVKTLSPQDLDFAVMGGLPAAAIIAFVGYGGAPVNILLAGNRAVLNNGFHRVYALRSMGISHVPVVVQHARNPALEFPPAVAGLPREYLLGAPRPVLMKDFFEPDFTVALRVRERVKMVTVGINLNQHEVPS